MPNWGAVTVLIIGGYGSRREGTYDENQLRLSHSRRWTEREGKLAVRYPDAHFDVEHLCSVLQVSYSVLVGVNMALKP